MNHKMADYLPNEGRGYTVTLQSFLLAECGQLTSSADFVNARILDIGCGHGATTAQIADFWPRSREVLGVDRERPAVDYAFAFVADERVDFAVADLEDPASLERRWGGRFDWIFSAQALLFVREQAAALRNALWCLRPGGRCYLAVPASKPADFHAAARKVLAADCWKRYFEPISELVSDMTSPDCNRLWFHHPHADRVYSALLEQVGFQVLHTKLADFRYVFSSPEEYKGCLRYLIRKPLQLVPEDKQVAFLKDFQKTASKKAKKTAGGSVIWNLKYAVVLAKRPEM